MNLWAFLLGAGALLCMWLVSRTLSSQRVTAPDIPDRGPQPAVATKAGGFRLLEAFVALAITVVLIMIAMPAYQDYTARSSVSQAADQLSGPHTLIAEVVAMAENPNAAEHLRRADTDLQRATEQLRAVNPNDFGAAKMQRVSVLLASALTEIDEAGIAEPSLRQSSGLTTIASDIKAVETHLAELASTSTPKLTQAQDRTWITVVLLIGTAFLVAVLSVYAFVVVKHGSGQTTALKRRLRVLIEPLVALFAIALGFALALFPGLEQATAMWGAGIAGSGVGYWLKAAGA